VIARRSRRREFHDLAEHLRSLGKVPRMPDEGLIILAWLS
jgi:hypothetical protein